MVCCRGTQQRSEGERQHAPDILCLASFGLSIVDMVFVVCSTHSGTSHTNNVMSTSGCTQASFLAERTGASAARLRAPLDLQGTEHELLRDFGAPGDAPVAFTFDCDSILARHKLLRVAMHCMCKAVVGIFEAGQ